MRILSMQSKKYCEKMSIAVIALTAVLTLTACGNVGGSSSEETTTATTVDREIHTTKTATYTNAGKTTDDEYTAMTTVTGQLDDSSFQMDDSYDENVRATITTTTVATETTAAPKTKKTTKASTTSFKKDTLNKLSADKEYPDTINYVVTKKYKKIKFYYGPSQSYDVIKTIPAKTVVVGYGETTDNKGRYWVYVQYKNKYGWVIKGNLNPV